MTKPPLDSWPEIVADREETIAILKAALMKAEEADQAHANCKECEGEGAPEECGECFDLADDARLMRRAALASCKS